MLTPAQLSALDLSTHTAIIANAGSGKTRVLVERYLKILFENPELRLQNIVAITFTDASARDLRKKIASSLNERLKNSKNSRERDRCLEIRQQLGSAYISTIHSFCIQLLRSYPVEANVDASFTILTSPEDQLLREECVRAAFYDILKEGYANENSPEAGLLAVFRLFGRRRITSLVHSFLASRFKIHELISGLYIQNDETVLRYWNRRIDEIMNKEILKEIDISWFNRLLQEKTTKGSNRLRAEEAVSVFRSAKTINEKVIGYSGLMEAFFTKEFTLNGNLFNKATKELYKNEADSIVTPFIKYRTLIDAYAESCNDPNSAQLYLFYSRQLLEVFTRVLDNYTQQKLNYSLLDYDDVIEYALRLVQIPEIQSELIKRFGHILIDEYQDTDAAQYAIAKAMSGNFQNENRLTVVGDPKQSIYSFRNADLELYLQTVREISASHGKNSPVLLSESFRMLSHPLAFINKVSENLFIVDKTQLNEYEFVPLIEGRNEGKEGTVEILLPAPAEGSLTAFDEYSDSDSDTISANEVQLVALKIRQIISDSNEKYFISEKNDNSSEARTPRFSDIAILLRSRTHQIEIESALRKNEIPFVTYGGKGFYSRAEIIDITNYLRFLINSHDDIALAGLLRSPYFGLSDIDLYRLAPENNSTSNLWQRLMLQISKDSRIARACAQLSENLQLVGRVSTQLLLQKIITESGILGILQPLSDGDQKIANLEKYQRFALAFGKEGYSGTYDFIERITLLMERDEMEAQAEPQNDLNAVHLMTIHNAKGLEFPVVFLPYLHGKVLSGDARRIRSSLDKELGIGVDLPEQAKMQPVVELIKIRAKEKEIEEEKRIFYVAMTRARDHLILSASAKNSYKNTRIGWVFESLGLDDFPIDNSSMIVTTSIARYRAEGNLSKTYTEPLTFSIPVIRRPSDISFSPGLPDTAVEVLSAFEFLLEDVPPSESIGRYSPSQLLTYLECPTKYYLRYQLGLPEEARLPYYNEADTLAENVQGSLFGQIVHKVLEKSNSFAAEGSINNEAFTDIFDSVCSDLRLSDDDRTKFFNRVRTDIGNVVITPLGKEAFAAEHYHTELPLRAKLQSGQMLSGIIDRLFLGEDGIWNILDYKTDGRESVQKKKRYEFQLQFYAYLVSLLYDQKVVKAHVLYTRTGNTLSYTFAEKDFSGIGNKLEVLVSELRSQKKSESLDAIERNLSHCPECPYFDLSQNLCIAGAGKEPIKLQTELLFL